ncbi:MAG: M20/M25/M40 family metallo-hydrolase [Candidatus Saccharicenans sp.]|uniref:M20/M25/M40 family metallo-hydrolase n=1 Tax=Candidatus Saccharicenans sp. TaxID=2819258 RepID=UPI00404AD46E
MKNNFKKATGFLILLVLALTLSQTTILAQPRPGDDSQKLLRVFHGISSNTLFEYVKELTSDKYTGRLTGTPGYNLSADWVISLLKKWGVEPAGDNGTYLQAFPNPYTLILDRGEVSMQLKVGKSDPKNQAIVKKYYLYEDEYFPGGTSASGEITAEVVYVGYGITAPELGYDDYQGVDVRGKIVLMENEVPYSPDKDPEVFKKWRPYSFHQYKLQNAAAHGARGMLYYYGPICNPNNDYIEGFIYSHVGRSVVDDIFAGTGRTYQATVEKIRTALKPQSFATGKVFTIKNKTEHHPEGIGYNVLGKISGSDPVLKDEVIIIGGHLDHLGLFPELMPGANDNASAVAVMLGVAEAIMKSEVKPKRTILLAFFGAEEQGVKGSEYYVQHPVFPREKTVGLINMDGVGSGERIFALAGKNFPWLYAPFEKANASYLHREMGTNYWANLTRPRLDAARFMDVGLPSLSFSTSGLRLPYPTYHNTRDNISLINPEILEDMARLVFLAVMELASAPAEALK